MKAKNDGQLCNRHAVRDTASIDSGFGAGMTTREVNGRNESGRSMTEMLGVLAIMALLSAVSITGYLTAMTKLRTNEILHQLNSSAHFCAQQYSFSALENTSCDASDFLTQMSYASISNPFESIGTVFQTSVSNLSPQLCNSLNRALEKWTVAKVSHLSCAGAASENQITLQFKKDLGAWKADEQATVPCQTNAECSQGTCINGGCKTCDKISDCTEYNTDCSCTKCPSIANCLSFDPHTCLCAECEKNYFINPVGSCGNCNSNEDCSTDKWCTSQMQDSWRDMSYRCVDLIVTEYPMGVQAYTTKRLGNKESAENFCDRVGGYLPTRSEWAKYYAPIINTTGVGSITSDGGTCYSESSNSTPYCSASYSPRGYAYCIPDQTDNTCAQGLILNEETGKCVDCLTDADCADNTNGKLHCSPYNTCEVCVDDADCSVDEYCTGSTMGKTCPFRSGTCISKSTYRYSTATYNGIKFAVLSTRYLPYYTTVAACKALGGHVPTVMEYYGIANPTPATGTVSAECSEGYACNSIFCLLSDDLSPNYKPSGSRQHPAECFVPYAFKDKMLISNKTSGGTSSPNRSCCVIP